MNSKILFQKTKLGNINQWRCYTIGNILYTEFGMVGGKLQTTPGQICEGTNIGKSNERTPEQQVVFEMEVKVKAQLRMKYSETVEETEEVKFQAMLAADGKKVKFNFPVDIQPKLDGLRCGWDGTKLISRGNKIYSVKHIEDQLKIISPSIPLDGELYCHGESLQQLNSWIKKPQEDSLRLEYWVYDTQQKGTWLERKLLLSKIQFEGPVKLVQTTLINSLDKLVRAHDLIVEAGYEGLIIRLHNGMYEFGKRSRALLKWKESEDSEFKIIGMRAGTGKYSTTPVFMCKNDINDLTFEVVPIGDMESKKEMLDKSNIGKMLTVKYFGRTEDGIPKFGVGKNIREDL